MRRTLSGIRPAKVVNVYFKALEKLLGFTLKFMTYNQHILGTLPVLADSMILLICQFIVFTHLRFHKFQINVI